MLELDFRSLYEHSPVGLYRALPDGRLLMVNPAMLRMLGYSSFAALAQLDFEQAVLADDIPRSLFRARIGRDGAVIGLESRWRRADGRVIVVRESAHVVYDEQGAFCYYDGTVEDITDRKREEETQVQFEQLLRQTQKMEGIGQLAGGIAHDFNNLITVIQGHCDLIEAELASNSLLRADLQQIRAASQRASGLTRQLLAFSRKQILNPEVISLNELVTNVCTMLDRLIGEDIMLSINLEQDLYPIIADSGQIEQVIMNLMLNARDAMPNGGTMLIETSNILIDHDYAIVHPEAPVGSCVMLTVSDTGYGMDEQTRARIFEPFFTTKAPGKGTGLGLATVYGIVKQSGGEISVVSQLKQGTAFRILLPASPDAVSDRPVPPVAIATGGNETILLVEDDMLVRNLVRTVLRKEGYTILEAAHGHEAMSLARQNRSGLDLLVTDIVMPRISGRDLAEQISVIHPRLKVLFMSGYTDQAVVQHGLQAARVDFLAKPFSAVKLAVRVREVLDRGLITQEQLPKPYYDSAHDALKQALNTVPAVENTRSFAQAMYAQGGVLAVMGELSAAQDMFMSSQTVFHSLGDRQGQAIALERLGWVARERGDIATAMAKLEESIALSREINDKAQIAWTLLTTAGVAILGEDAVGAEQLIAQAEVLEPDVRDWLSWRFNHLGHAAQLRREYDLAEQLHQKSLEVFVKHMGAKNIGVIWAYQGLGETALGKGNAELAQYWLRDGLQLSQDLGARSMLVWYLSGLGGVAALQHAPQRAARLWCASERLRTILGFRPAPAARDTYERLLAMARAQIGIRAFTAAWEEGGALSLNQAINEALGSEG